MKKTAELNSAHNIRNTIIKRIFAEINNVA